MGRHFLPQASPKLTFLLASLTDNMGVHKRLSKKGASPWGQKRGAKHKPVGKRGTGLYRMCKKHLHSGHSDQNRSKISCG